VTREVDATSFRAERTPGARPGRGLQPAPGPPPGLPQNLIWRRQGCLRILDQRALPGSVRYLECDQADAVADAIACLAVRGAPAIGIAAAYGVALAAARHAADPPAFERAVARLATARPTAVQLATTVADVAARVRPLLPAGGTAAQAEALRAARRLRREDAEACAALARLGAELLGPAPSPADGGGCPGGGPRAGWVLTHCHTGYLATGGVGTALGAIALAYRQGRIGGVFACEARPLWQGARLTAWECGRLGLPCRLIADGAAGSLLAAGRVCAVLVGADRIAANGDAANKVGTYPLAVLAHRHAVPFYVLAPSSTLDPSLPSGAAIPIEERAEAEVLQPAAALGARAWNPAFDVTPAGLISAIVTEGGIHRRPYRFPPATVRAGAGRPAQEEAANA
jgi:methylthioribose-1-phosphate isomerase